MEKRRFWWGYQDLVNKIEILIQKALSLAIQSKNDLFAIEIHGGESRILPVKKKIILIFGKE
jgi:molecular chaperone DnaK (HSP70)